MKKPLSILTISVVLVSLWMPFQTVSAQDAAPKRVYITGGTTEAPGGPGGAGSSGTTNTNTVITPCTNCNMGYTPLEPIPGITPENGTYDLTSPGGFSKLINALFKILITAGALIAVLSLTIGGVQYMVSGSAAIKGKAMERVRASLWGILLIAGIWLILNTINPQLLNFNFNPCSAGSNSSSCTWYSYTNSPASSNTTNSSNSTFSAPGTSLDGLIVNQDNCAIVRNAVAGSLTDYSAVMLNIRAGARTVFTDTTMAQTDQKNRDFLNACGTSGF